MGWGPHAPGYTQPMATETQGTRGGGVERQGPQGLKMRLGSGPEAAADARRAIAELRADLDPPLMETLRLLVTELVTNSVRHTAADSVTLRVAVGKTSVLTEGADTGPGFVRLSCGVEDGADLADEELTVKVLPLPSLVPMDDKQSPQIRLDVPSYTDDSSSSGGNWCEGQ